MFRNYSGGVGAAPPPGLRAITAQANLPAMSDAILLPAAGQSSRMRGRDKLLETIDGEALLRRQSRRARSTCPRVFVALPPPPHPRYAVLDGLDVTTLEVPEHTEGLGGTLRGAVARLPRNIDRLVLLLPDLPDIDDGAIREVLAAADAFPDALVLRGATSDGRPGHPVVFDKTLLPVFAELSGNSGGTEVIKAAGDRVVLHRFTGDQARCDLDTPEEWAEWRLRSKRPAD